MRKGKIVVELFALLFVGLFLIPSSSVLAEAFPPNLTVFGPEINGLTVNVNGVVFPGAPGTTITRIHWDWGDGNSEDHWFPATHTYADYGSYTITVTTHQSDGLYSTETFSFSTPIEIIVFSASCIEFQVPDWYSSTIIDYDMVRIVDQGFLLEKQLVQTNPPLFKDFGVKQIIRYNPTMDPSVAHSGNPVQMGRFWWAPSHPAWFGYFHEIGHNFEVAQSYYNLVPMGGQPLVPFSEGFASLAYLYIAQLFSVRADHYNVNDTGYSDLMKDYADQKQRFISALGEYEDTGSDYNIVDADVVDGIFLELAQQYGWGMYES